MTSSDEPAAGKVCTKCGEWKPWDGFSTRSRSKDGKMFWCKSCEREYREENRDLIAKQKREYREANRVRITDYRRKYRSANSELIAYYQRKYREENRDLIAKQRREYRDANRECLQFRSKKISDQNKRRALKRSLPSETVLLREIALRDGATCWMCGDELSEWNPAHLDHLVPLSADTDQLAAWGLENPGTVRANMALACPSCNIRKSNRLMLCALARYLRNLSAESELAA